VLALLDRASAWLARLADLLSAFICAFLIVATTLAMLVYQFGIAIAWLDDVLRMLLIWLVYLGTVSLCLANDHITMDAFYTRMGPRTRRAVDWVVALFGVVICGYTAKIGYESTRQSIEFDELLSAGYIPAWIQTAAIPLCFGLMCLAYLSFLSAVIRNRVVRAPSEADRAVTG